MTFLFFIAWFHIIATILCMQLFNNQQHKELEKSLNDIKNKLNI